ncbi:MAG: CehA/McbA family metallohydrolase [Chloroflexia bacterium]
MPLYEYPGAFHIHSVHSDGSGTIPEIAEAARQAGLRWVVISDHDTLAGLEAGEAGWYGDVLVVIGYEITPERNHYLVLGLEEVLPAGLSPAEFIAAVRSRGGWGFVLHPDERLGAYFKPALPWDNWTLRGFDGLEIWNVISEWTEGLTERNRLLRYAFPLLAVRGPTSRTLAWWDDLLASGEHVSAVGGLDVHATRYSLLGRFLLEIYPYRRMFGTLTNYLLLREALSSDGCRAARQVGEGLARGFSFLAYRRLGEARGFRFLAEKAGQFWIPGETVPPGGDIHLTVHSPRRGQIRLFHNGRLLACRRGKGLHWQADRPGAYRVEVRRLGRPWLYSNPIWVEEP